jgi:hypothetical protein
MIENENVYAEPHGSWRANGHVAARALALLHFKLVRIIEIPAPAHCQNYL